MRFLLLRLGDDDLERSLRLAEALFDAGHRPTPAHRTLAAGRRLRGRLMGALVGLTAAQFDQGWGEDEWSVRRVAGHLIAVDRRYRIGARHAVERFRAGGVGPLRPPDAGMPERTGRAESEGTMAEVLAQLQEAHDEAMDGLANVAGAELEAPTNWASWDVDVRFRLQRFADHDREHLVQIRKTLAAIGFVPTEPQRLLEEAAAARGDLEARLVGVTEDSAGAAAAAAALTEAAAAERALVAQTVRAAQ
ncbi:MAG: DinB family protein [Dehalococcoidia bacterium]